MATTTTRLSLRKPATTDNVNVTTDISNNMDTLDTAAGFERRTDFPSSPFTGKAVMRSDQSDRCYVYDGTNWEEVLIVSAIMKAQHDWDGTDVTTTSSSYTSLSPAVEITFVAPPSGAVYVTVSANLECVSPSSAFASWEMRETNSSGTIKHSATDDVKAVAQQADAFHQGEMRSIASGLTAGDTYYARVMCRSTTSNTASFFYRGLLIEPVLNI